MKTIYLAGGCFWGVQHFIDSANGVVKTVVGYANGQTENPTYEEVRYLGSGHTETCLVEYDESILSLNKLIGRFLEVIDPFSINKQGEDEGISYRSGIYYLETEDLKIIKEEIQKVEKAHLRKVAWKSCL